MVPGQPFNYTFMDADFNKVYTAEEQTGKLFITFAVFAIFIGCLGLFGLVTYAAEQRIKEIGIRKVLGATAGQIIVLVTKDYIKLILIAGIVAVPVAYILLQNWLKDYAFHIQIGVWFFLLPLVLIVLIALITVLYQSIKAAIANPVKSLRTE